MIEPRRVRIELASEPRRCPACQRVIYQRRRPICEFCDEPIPEELQLSEAEVGAINVELAEMQLRRQQDKEREEEKKRSRVAVDDGGAAGAAGGAALTG
jgi:hypothetical protein